MKKTILLLEDDEASIAGIKKALDSLDTGYALHIARNGVDALALLNGNSANEIKVLPDIILLDIDMPQMNGLEFLGIIKNYYSLKNISIYVMASSVEEYDLLAANNSDVSGYILKPLRFKDDAGNVFAESAAKLKAELCGQRLNVATPAFAATSLSASNQGLFQKLLSRQKIFTSGAGLVILSIVVFAALGLLYYETNNSRHKKVMQPVPEVLNTTTPAEKTPAPVAPETPITVSAPVVKIRENKSVAPQIISVMDTLNTRPVVPQPQLTPHTIKVKKAVQTSSESPVQKNKDTDQSE